MFSHFKARAAALALIVFLLPSFCLGQEPAADREIGGPASGPSANLDLTSLIAPAYELGLGLEYLNLNSDDEAATYSGIPALLGTVSMAVGHFSRFYLGAGYGRVKGDPYYDLAGDFGDNESTLQTVPFLLGLKLDMATRARLRLNLDAALALAYVKESLPGTSGDWYDPDASGVISGFVFSVGPDFPLNQAGDRWLGLSGGWTLLKGEIEDHGREIDLTGWHIRAHFVMEL